jgi:uncharacterized membrane protein YcaP (DUF421 family)
MESIIRSAAIYLFLMLIFRISGRRTLQESSTFDLVLMLVIGSAVKDAMIGGDLSLTNAIVVSSTLLLLNVLFSLLKLKFPYLDKWISGVPLILVENGELLQHRAYKSRVTVTDILSAARAQKGIERIDQIKYAVLERNGAISIIPREEKIGDQE